MTSAIEKVQDVDKKIKIVNPLPENVPWDANSMVVSTPHEVCTIIRAIPKGKLVTLSTIREYLAHKYNTDIACPVSTAIFINITARAAQEMKAQHSADAPPPYWRVLRPDGSLNPKYPDGTDIQKQELEAEGYTCIHKRTKIIVENFEHFLWDIHV